VPVGSKNGCEATVFTLRIFGQANSQISFSCRQFVNFDIPDIDFLLSLFNATVAPFRDWFRQIGLRLWTGDSPFTTPATAQVYCQQIQTVSFIKGGEFFHALCKRLSFGLVTYFMRPIHFAFY